MSRLSASVTWRSPGKIKGRMDVPGPLARKDSAMTRRIVLLATSMARLLARHKPPGAVETMLSYLPFADNEQVADEARALLAQLAMPEGKPHPALAAALTDKLPARRAAAGEALAKGGGPDERIQAKK